MIMDKNSRIELTEGFFILIEEIAVIIGTKKIEMLILIFGDIHLIQKKKAIIVLKLC